MNTFRKLIVLVGLFLVAAIAGGAAQPRAARAMRPISPCVECADSGLSCSRGGSYATCTLTSQLCRASGTCNIW